VKCKDYGDKICDHMNKPYIAEMICIDCKKPMLDGEMFHLEYDGTIHHQKCDIEKKLTVFKESEKMIDKTKIPEQLEAIRERMMLTLGEFAKLLDMSVNTYTRIIRMKGYQVMQASNLRKIVKFIEDNGGSLS
jgi:DNA-binding transcriptional regulator YiaG